MIKNLAYLQERRKLSFIYAAGKHLPNCENLKKLYLIKGGTING